MISAPRLIHAPLKTAETLTVSKSELRVLHVFSVLGMGGAETWLMSLLKYFKEHEKDLPVRVRFDVLLTGGQRAVFDDEAKALGARLFYVPFTRRTLPSFTREFRRILDETNYDAIHDHQDYIAGLHFLMAGRHVPAKRVAHVHTSLQHIANYRKDQLRHITSLAGKRLLRYFATDILGTSAQLLNEYGFTRKSFPEAVIVAAHCGFDVNRFRTDPHHARVGLCEEFDLPLETKLLLFVGRLDSNRDRELNQKNPKFALEVARACIERNSTCCLLMVGEGGEEIQTQLRSQIASWRMNEKILILGMRSDVPQLMLGSDLLLLPSLAEGLGMVAVEAQAAGLRVLASEATPRECVVVEDMVSFESLAQGPVIWAEKALRLLEQPRVDVSTSNDAVGNSAFSIENSALNLLQIYSRDSQTQ